MIKYTFGIMLVGLLFSSCNRLYYQSDFLVELDAQDYKSYYTEVQCDDDVNPTTAQRIIDAVDENCKKIGYTKSDDGDLLIKYLIKNTSRQFVEECVQEYGRFSGGEYCRERVVTYKEGSLIIDIINADTNEIVWHGAAYGPSFNDWKDADSKVNEMVGTLFQRYTSNTK